MSKCIKIATSKGQRESIFNADGGVDTFAIPDINLWIVLKFPYQYLRYLLVTWLGLQINILVFHLIMFKGNTPY